MTDNPYRSPTSLSPSSAESPHANWLHVGVFLALIVFGAGMRLVPHEWNFSPLGAIALFAGVHFRKSWAVVTPLVALLVSDTIMHFTGIHNRPGFYPGMQFTYLAFVAMACVGMVVGRYRRPVGLFVGAIAGGTVAGSVALFLISNFGAWLALENLYPRTLEGLIACYVAAIPFYRQTLLSNLVFVPLLFGIYALVEFKLPALASARAGR
jgi:hypothetical protein